MFKSPKTIFLVLLVLFLPAVLALDAPDVSSITHPENEWSNFKDLIFKWDEVDGANRYCYVLDSSSSNDAPDEPCTNDLTVILPPKISSGDYYFHVKSVSGSQESATTTFHIKLDIGSPPKPVLSGESLPDGSIKLTWEVEEDDASGLDKFQIYRSLMAGIDLRGLGVQRIGEVSNPSRTFSDVNNMEQSRTYHYVVRAIDSTGNIGRISNEVHIETTAKCDLDINFLVLLSGDGETLELSISSNEPIYHGALTAELPGGEQHKFFEEIDPFSDWSGSLDLSSISQGYIDFSLAAKEFFGDDCSLEKRHIFDVTEPDATFIFPKYNDNVSETVPLQTRAEDKGSFKSGIKSVTYYLKQDGSWSEIGKGEEKEDNIYEFGWDTLRLENGKKELRVVVFDEAENKVEATKVVNVLNAFEGAVDLNSATEQALRAREEALVSKWDLERQAIVSKTVDRLVDDGDSNFSEAMRLAEQGGIENETNAKQFLAQAIVLYQESEAIVSTSIYKESDFIFNQEQVEILLNAAGVSGGQAVQAKELIAKYNPERKLQILEVVDDNATYYRALIVVSFSLDINILQDSNIGDNVIQIMEVVPKEFAEYAAELDSNISFTILNDDPKILFTLKKEQYRKRQLVYGLKDDLSQPQANALIEENVVNKFVTPPIMLYISDAFFVLPDFSYDLLIFLVFGLSIIGVVIGIVIFVKKSKGGFKLSFGKKSKFDVKGKKTKFVAKEEKEKKPKKEKPKGKFPNIKLPKIRKKDESPLSVFGKK